MRNIKTESFYARIPIFFLAGFALLSMVVLVIRVFLVRTRLNAITGSGDDYALAVIRHDSTVIALLLSLFLLSGEIRNRTLAIPLRIAGLLLTCFYFSDLMVFNLFNLRLHWGDVLIYGKDVKAVYFQLFSMMGSGGKMLMPILLLLLGAAFLAYLLIPFRIPNRVLVAGVMISALFLIMSVTVSDVRGSHAWTVRNILETNWPNGASRDFSPEFEAGIRAGLCRQDQRTINSSSAAKRPNIILVIFESLSVYHTGSFLEQDSVVPRFDAISRKGTVFEDFFSNSYNTDGGLIALLTGNPPLPAAGNGLMGTMGGFEGYFGVEDTLPANLKMIGYHTVFATSGDLSFSRKGEWLRSIGFDGILGHDEPYYEGTERFQFRSVSDGMLYENIVRNVLPDLEERQPYFLVIENVSTHHPFIEPEGRSTRERDVFLYADRQLGRFHDALEERGFLEDGLLVVTSDHRSMTPLRRDEYDRYGEESPARVPLTVMGLDVEAGRTIEGYFQQSDLKGSIEYLTGNARATFDKGGNLFSEPPAPSKYVLYYSGNERDRVDVFTPDGAHAIRLRGDETAFAGNRPEDAKEILDFVNCVRTRAGDRID
ncbi:MAG: LTA synthase family protein [bacterium]|nr:MAG: LTA synthase family protein [bacterium]